ncbi:MAG: hypothetical protein AAGB22_12330, partial [Bacteroidota bacterium]
AEGGCKKSALAEGGLFLCLFLMHHFTRVSLILKAFARPFRAVAIKAIIPLFRMHFFRPKGESISPHPRRHHHRVQVR